MRSGSSSRSGGAAIPEVPHPLALGLREVDFVLHTLRHVVVVAGHRPVDERPRRATSLRGRSGSTAPSSRAPAAPSCPCPRWRRARCRRGTARRARGRSPVPATRAPADGRAPRSSPAPSRSAAAPRGWRRPAALSSKRPRAPRQLGRRLGDRLREVTLGGLVVRLASQRSHLRVGHGLWCHRQEAAGDPVQRPRLRPVAGQGRSRAARPPAPSSSAGPAASC